ncbi:hypothetical protein RRG08_057858 [Elysia crispata]|uniref:Uncharacterized protein n=1 Tax=Elysia crispata TaxID=231223 RepID=A0AAE1DG05_9GAST|nr:hypothetical protein RRG08_057858 [Elysia crispata]
MQVNTEIQYVDAATYIHLDLNESLFLPRDESLEPGRVIPLDDLTLCLTLLFSAEVNRDECVPACLKLSILRTASVSECTSCLIDPSLSCITKDLVRCSRNVSRDCSWAAGRLYNQSLVKSYTDTGSKVYIPSTNFTQPRNSRKYEPHQQRGGDKNPESSELERSTRVHSLVNQSSHSPVSQVMPA